MRLQAGRLPSSHMPGLIFLSGSYWVGRYYDVTVGSGPEVKEGARIAIHYDARWRGITFMTSRYMIVGQAPSASLEQQLEPHQVACNESQLIFHGHPSGFCAPFATWPVSACSLVNMHRAIMHWTCHKHNACGPWCRQGMGVTGGEPMGFDVGAKAAGGTLKGLDLVSELGAYVT